RPGSRAAPIWRRSSSKTSCCRVYVIRPMPLRRMSDDFSPRLAIASDLLREVRMRKLVVPALVLVFGPLLFAASTGYHVLNEIKIGGEGGWDYLTVDSAARRLYVSHATHVVVVDLDKNTVVGDIPDTPGVHGIAIAPELNKGFISNGRGNNVTIFDLKTLKATGTVPTEMNPDAIRYDAKSGRVFAFNGRSRSAT